MFRISDSADCWVADVDTVEQIGATAQSVMPGHYLVEEIGADDNSVPSRHRSRAWGTAIHHPDGRVVLRQFFYCDSVASPLDRIRARRSLRRNYPYRTSNPWTFPLTWPRSAPRAAAPRCARSASRASTRRSAGRGIPGDLQLETNGSHRTP
jgi:hypothetical protein